MYSKFTNNQIVLAMKAAQEIMDTSGTPREAVTLILECMIETMHECFDYRAVLVDIASIRAPGSNPADRIN